MMGTFDVFAGKQRRLVGDEILQRARMLQETLKASLSVVPLTHI